ncbi:MAG TPA: amidase [Candidatus Lustribacter sp.]|nr:amidase [Candidatus Lustribacter sp.]
MTIRQLREQLDRGEVTSRALCEAAFARIDDAAGEGARTFTELDRTGALAAADAADTQRRAGYVASAIAGMPVSVKDLFDVAGSTTRAGSVVLDGAAPATADATIIGRLRRAGAVIVGKTNMTEFAYSGLGINPHFGTPLAPYDRATGRVPGGSSSGAAVSVADGMVVAAIGTDTGGSVRIPAAFCGIVGFKPTAARVPLTGAYPLSFTLDSIGPLARSVACCATLDAILAGEAPPALDVPPVRRWRFLAPVNYVRGGLDATVEAAFAAGLASVRAAGAQVDEIPLPAFERLPVLPNGATITGAEAYWSHRELLAGAQARYDPQIARRILRGATITAAEYIEMLLARRAYISAFHAQSEGYDALLWPTVAIVPPPVRALEADDDAYASANALILRNTSTVNALDGCALSLPLAGAGGAPAGLMVVGRNGEDARLLRIGAAVEAVLR